MSDTGCQMPDARCQIPDTGYRMPDVSLPYKQSEFRMP
jgi:hypothetical protein